MLCENSSHFFLHECITVTETHREWEPFVHKAVARTLGAITNASRLLPLYSLSTSGDELRETGVSQQ